jgi:hypothetical protein
VTLAGMQAVAGSVVALVTLISVAQQLNGAQMTETLNEIVKQEQVKALDLTVDSARDLLRYSIMAMSVLSAASLVLGIFVLKRHRAARVGLTVVGVVVGIVLLVAGPVGWVGTLYIGVSIFLLWSRPARAWFGDEVTPRGGAPGGPQRPDQWSGPPDGGPPSGPPPSGPPYAGPPSGPPHAGPPSGPPNGGPPTGPRRDVDGRLPAPTAPTGSSDGDGGHDEDSDEGGDRPSASPAPPPPPPRR